MHQVWFYSLETLFVNTLISVSANTSSWLNIQVNSQSHKGEACPAPFFLDTCGRGREATSSVKTKLHISKLRVGGRKPEILGDRFFQLSLNAPPEQCSYLSRCVTFRASSGTDELAATRAWAVDTWQQCQTRIINTEQSWGEKDDNRLNRFGLESMSALNVHDCTAGVQTPEGRSLCFHHQKEEAQLPDSRCAKGPFDLHTELFGPQQTSFLL